MCILHAYGKSMGIQKTILICFKLFYSINNVEALAKRKEDGKMSSNDLYLSHGMKFTRTSCTIRMPLIRIIITLAHRVLIDSNTNATTANATCLPIEICENKWSRRLQALNIPMDLYWGINCKWYFIDCSKQNMLSILWAINIILCNLIV